MPEAKSARETQTKPLAPDPGPPLATLHVVALLRWDREWHESFEVRRNRLLDVVAGLHAQMSLKAEKGRLPMKSLVLGGQTVILEDIAGVRPDLVTLLVIFNAGGRLGIGPWYVTVDGALVSGEAMIRNLLAGRDTADQYGLKLMPVSYTPTSVGYPAQLPQILRGFGIDSAFLRQGTGVTHLPFRWDAPNGASVLVVNHEVTLAWPPPEETVSAVSASVAAQRNIRPDGPFLFLFDACDTEQSFINMLADTRRIGLPLQQSDLRIYANTLRRELPDSARPSVRGELRLQALQKNNFSLRGTLSSRIYLKQHNARLQNTLSYGVEPWLTVALTHGRSLYADNMRASLRYAWRLLMQNQAQNALGGTGSDAVHRDNERRYQQVADVAGQLEYQALAALPGKIHTPGEPVSGDETFVSVWNGLNWPVKQAVELWLRVPPGKHPAEVIAPDGTTAHFAWESLAAERGRLIFLADAPAIGYASYRVRLSDHPPDRKQHGISVVPGQVIAHVSGETLTVQDGKLTWKRGDQVVEDLLRFIDSGDAGDAYNFSPPEEDVVVQATLVNDVKLESTALYERLIINHRMRVAPGLNAKRNRERGLKLVQMQTTATFYEGVPGLHLRTTFENTARDHRLRAHLRTGVRADRVLADNPFCVLERPVRQPGDAFPPPNESGMEGVSQTHPVQTVVSVQDNERAVALLVRGLPEYEADIEDGQTSLALTLTRAVGWLSRDDLRTRTANVAPPIETPEGQCLRPMVAEYALLDLPPGDHAALLRHGATFNAPLRAHQYDDAPKRPRRSFLSVLSDQGTGGDSDGAGAIVAALKPPEKGPGWVVRLFNPLDHPVEVYITPFKRPRKAYLVTLSEEPEGAIEPDANGWVAVTINAHEIVTLLLVFDDMTN